MPTGIQRALLLALLLLFHRETARAQSVAATLAQALRDTQASAVIVDLKTGKVLANLGAARKGTPGSAIKPFVLEWALDHGLVTPESGVVCHRNLRIGKRSLPCTHPANRDIFVAESALAESCNTYFAELGRRYSGPSLDRVFQRYGLAHRGIEDEMADGRALTALGLQGTIDTPLELAFAYRRLALSMPKNGPVARGLAGSVVYGMANPALVKGLRILGKTGTAINPGETWTHGWFAGILPGRLVIVILLPRGDGGAAAQLANAFFIGLRRTGATQ